MPTLDQLQHKIADLTITYGPRLAVALLILAAGVVVARWAGKAFAKAIAHLDLEPPVRKLLGRILRLLVVGLFAIIALQNLGVELLPLIAGLGVAGAGLALATQGVLSNLVAGFTIIFTKPFRVGHYVAMLGVEGRVESIDLFSTTLSHPDLSRIVVPNRKIVGEILHNYSAIRQLDLTVSVSYDGDLRRVLTIIREILAANPKVLKDPSPFVGVSSLADSSISIAVQPWVDVPYYVQGSTEVYQAILERFQAERLDMPFPRQDIRLVDSSVAQSASKPRSASM